MNVILGKVENDFQVKKLGTVLNKSNKFIIKAILEYLL